MGTDRRFQDPGPEEVGPLPDSDPTFTKPSRRGMPAQTVETTFCHPAAHMVGIGTGCSHVSVVLKEQHD